MPNEAPNPNDVPLPAEGIDLAENQAGVWTAKKNVKTNAKGNYSTAFVFRFDAAGLDDRCEPFTLRANAVSSKQKVNHNAGERQLCA